jgi:hypothetical protein
MRLLRSVKRAAQVIALSVVVLVVGSSVYLRIEQYRFRRQAEQLLSDVRELESKKADAEEVRRVVRKWGFEEWKSPVVPCTYDGCVYYRVRLMAETARRLAYPNFMIWGTRGRVLGWLGLRSAEVESGLQIRGKALVSASFVAFTMGTGCNRSDCTLMAYAGTGTQGSFSEHDPPDVTLRHSLLHPSYLAGTYPTTSGAYAFTGAVVWTELSPNANSADVSRLMRFDLSCLTRLRPCRDRDLMPNAWKQIVEDEHDSPRSLTCTPGVSKRAAQLADVIAIVRPKTVELSPPRYPGWPQQLAGLEIVSTIKKPEPPRLMGQLSVSVKNTELMTAADTQIPIRAGERYLFLMQSLDYGAIGPAALYPCGILTPNDANLAMVREAAVNGGDE